jgi:hypothetical protein
MVWDRPKPIGGVTMGYRILFLPSESTLTPELRSALDWKDVEFVGAPDRDWITLVSVTFNEPGVVMLVDGAADQANAFLSLPEDRRLQITFHTERLGESFRRSLADGFEEVLKQMRGAGLDPPQEGRVFITGMNGLGHFACEAYVRRPSPDPLGLLRL